MFMAAHTDADMYCIQFSFTTNLIAFEVCPSAGSKTLLAAEALEL